MIDIETAKPLGQWASGTLTLHFAEGAVVERKMHLDEARSVEAMLSGTRESDALRWDALAWFQFESPKVVFSSFKISEDGGWPMSPGERQAIAKAGHPHGVLRSLFDLWSDKDGPEPEYSLFALYQLHRAAVEGMARLQWDALATVAQGTAGAKAIWPTTERSEAGDGHGTPATADLDIDDGVDPEEATPSESVRAKGAGEEEDPIEDDARLGP